MSTWKESRRVSSVLSPDGLVAKLLANETMTYNLNWQYRRKYLLEQVLPSGMMDSLDHHGTYWLLHYRSDQYGASQARLTDDEMKDLRENEPNTAYLLDELPFTDIGPDEHVPIGPSIQHQLAEARDQPLLVYIDDEPVIVDAADAFLVEPDHMLSVQELKDLNDYPAPVPYVAFDEPATKEDVIRLLGGVPVEKIEGEPAKSPDEKKAAKKRAPASKKTMVLPKLPTFDDLPELVVPTEKQVYLSSNFENTLELKKVSGAIGSAAATQWVVAENSNYTDGDETIFDAVVRRGYAELRYWITPLNYHWGDVINSDDKRFQLIDLPTVLSTATAFFAGRLLSVLLTRRKPYDEPHGSLIQYFLFGELGEIGNQFTPEIILRMLDDEGEKVERAALDRQELVIRMLRQLVTTSRMPVGKITAKSFEHEKKHYALVDASRRICWHLNMTTPSGYAFFQGLLYPKKTFYTPNQTQLLSSLLVLTNKVNRT